ncbi:MAG: hypothetical protein OEV94_08815 [Deltaproteobacteria bacterium]|nr:hypothetical protein [Deltaproteobacteria bacterium]
MDVNLTPHSAAPRRVEQARYQALVARKQAGWSRCEEEEEWLAKLHYLRDGLANGKLDQAAFEEREGKLVLGWLAPLCQ